MTPSEEIAILRRARLQVERGEYICLAIKWTLIEERLATSGQTLSDIDMCREVRNVYLNGRTAYGYLAHRGLPRDEPALLAFRLSIIDRMIAARSQPCAANL